MPHTLRRQTTTLGGSTRSSTSRGSEESQESQESQSTAPTSVHDSPRPSARHAYTEPISSKFEYEPAPSMTYCARSSVDTYASGASEEDLYLEPESYESDPDYDVPEYREVVDADLRPTNPGDFADYFPSTNRLYIRHDDTTYDGNMNLRVDTEDLNRRKGHVQLFHLRMQDLKKREFSLRRYERGSGREVCHSSRKYAKSTEQRPPLAKSMSNALASMRKPDFKRTNSIMSTHSQKSNSGIQRQDSGYGGSIHEDDREISDFMSDLKIKSPSIPTNTTKLEFSNYAQIEVKRRGHKANKHYDFHYWGFKYTWKRVAEKYAEGKSVSYHLHKGEGPAIAHIVPELRSPSQIWKEDSAGGWVPPCSMWISDTSVVEALTDVADVIIATGLIALVDDCIKQHFNTKAKHSHSVTVPLTPIKYEMEFVSPKQMVEHIFKRTNSSGSAQEREPRSSPLKHGNHIRTY